MMGSASSTIAEAKHAHADFFDQYVLGVKIGKGAYAQVRVATRNDNTEFLSSNMDELSRKMAVRILDLQPKKQDGTHQMLQKIANNEIGIWKSLGCHDQCVRLYETFLDDRACYMVMEMCKSCLLAHLECMPELNERTLGGIFVQMLKGIEHVHSVKVVHRDVKSDNFLIGGDNASVVKLSDFGLAKMLPERGRLRGVYGTAPFMAPEMLQQLPYAQEIDVWSFGVVAYTLLFGSFPYEPIDLSPAAMKDAILDGFRPTFRQWNGVLRQQKRSDSTTAFVQAVLNRDPKTRPTASEALKLPFMVAVTEDSHMLGVELPSLRVTVQQAKKVGAFDNRDCCKQSVLDNYLNEMHFARHNVALPGVATFTLHEGMTKIPNSAAGVVHSELHSNLRAISRYPTNRGRFQSNPWEEPSDSTSCGTATADSTTSGNSVSTTSSKISQNSVQPRHSNRHLMPVAKWLASVVMFC